MDSLTQLTAGAAVGEAVLGPRVGRRAMLWGAILATLPDLDVFLPADGPVEAFVSHRSFSHSFFLLALLAPVAGWLISRIHPTTRNHLKRWILLAFLVLESSVFIDYLTVYGTQIFWPFDTTPQAWPLFFIIDPLFTLPLMAGCLSALLLTRNRRLGHRLNTAGLLLCLVYMLWAAGVREYVDHRVVSKLERQNVAFSSLTATPAPFTTFLHRYVGIDGDSYFETYYSIFDGNAPLLVTHYPRRLDLLRGLEEHRPVARLRWFTRGFYSLAQEGEQIVVSDLRMGSEPYYVFRFAVARRDGPVVLPMKAEQLDTRFDRRQLAWVWTRIWEPSPIPAFDRSVIKR